MELTEEQKRRIEEKRLNALKIRRMKEVKSALGVSQSTISSNSHSSLNPWSLSSRSVSSAPIVPRPPVQDRSSGGMIEVDMKTVLCSPDRVALHFKFDRQTIDAIKQVATSAYNPDTRLWTVNIYMYRHLIKVLSALKNSNVKVKFSSSVPNSVIVAMLDRKSKVTSEIDLTEKLNAKFVDEMFEFQKEAVMFGIQRDGRVLIADDMGLGKTVQALALAYWYREDWPLLIICPSSLRYQWKKSILFWVDTIKEHHVAVVDNGSMDISRSSVVIISYDLMIKFKKVLKELKFQCVIADESHYIKNDTAARTKTAVEIMKYAKRLFLLSGTPALSRPIELYTQINVIDNRIFSSKNDFGERYCDGRTTRWGRDFRGSSNAEELKIILESTIMIRRLKSEVLNQLPSKRRIKVVLNVDFVDKMEHKMKSYSTQIAGLKNRKGSNDYKQVLFNWFTHTAEAKAAAVCEYVRNLVEQDKKFIFFAHHKYMLDTIAEMLEKENCGYIRIDGSTPPKLRLQCCEHFQADQDCRVAVISIVAASVGINLTAANLVVFAELFWNPGILTQAEDRAHRIGQNDSVLVEYLVAPKTVDDFIWPMITRKFKVLNDVGLSKDSFKDAGTTDANQKLIDDFFTTIPVEQAPEI